MIYITSYESPDIDGIACMIGYAELLAQKGVVAKAIYFGELGMEVAFVKNTTHYFPIERHVEAYNKADTFVLVDVSEPENIDPFIDLSAVLKIFDHHQKNNLEKFVNSKNQVEMVGSCATLITELLMKEGVKPTSETALYLYAAIVSNTVNFKLSITTAKDKEAAAWLKKIAKVDNDFIKEMFMAKSNITKENLFDVLFQDFVVKTISDKKIGIAQVEMVGVQRMATDLREALMGSMERLKNEHELDYIFFNGIDVFEGTTIFYSIDKSSLELFSRILDLPDLTDGLSIDYILMRKQIWPRVDNVLKFGL